MVPLTPVSTIVTSTHRKKEREGEINPKMGEFSWVVLERTWAKLSCIVQFAACLTARWIKDNNQLSLFDER